MSPPRPIRSLATATTGSGAVGVERGWGNMIEARQMDTMVGRLARVIRAARHGIPETLARPNELDHEVAKAALAALLEPTSEMLSRGIAELRDPTIRTRAAAASRAWTAMLAAALTEA